MTQGLAGHHDSKKKQSFLAFGLGVAAGSTLL